MMLKILILIIVPFGAAILFGAAAERWAGKALSGWFALAGLIFGIYLLPILFDLIGTQ